MFWIQGGPSRKVAVFPVTKITSTKSGFSLEHMILDDTSTSTTSGILALVILPLVLLSFKCKSATSSAISGHILSISASLLFLIIISEPPSSHPSLSLFPSTFIENFHTVILVSTFQLTSISQCWIFSFSLAHCPSRLLQHAGLVAETFFRLCSLAAPLVSPSILY